MEEWQLIDYSKRRKFIETYRGFDIMKLKYMAFDKGHYFISKNGNYVSVLALHSVKAARNVIDTFWRANPPIYTPSTELTVQSVNQ